MNIHTALADLRNARILLERAEELLAQAQSKDALKRTKWARQSTDANIRRIERKMRGMGS